MMRLNDMYEKYYDIKFFELPYGILVFPPRLNLYVNIRKKYMYLSKDMRNRYNKVYNRYNNIVDIYNDGINGFREAISPVITEVKKDLISMGISDYNDEDIYDFMDDHNLFDSFFSKYIEIVNMLDEVRDLYADRVDYRKQRIKDSFSANNSLFGRFKHEIVNGIEDNNDLKQITELFDNIFKRESTKEVLMDGFAESVYSCHFGILMFLTISDYNINWSLPKEEKYNEGKDILKRIENKSIPIEAREAAYNIIFKYMYHKTDIYIHLLNEYGDKDGSIKELARYFGTDFDTAKDKLALDFVKKKKVKTEEDAEKAKELLIDYCDEIKLDVSDKLECISYINDIIDKFDVDYRTVEGILFKSRDEADNAREELPKIQFIMKNIREPRVDDLLDYEEGLKKRRKLINKTSKTKIKNPYINKINDYLAKFDENFCSVGFMGGKLNRKEAGLKRLLKLIKELPNETQEDIKKLNNYCEELLPKVGLTKEEAYEAYKYINEFKEPKALEFIKGISINSEEDAKEAKNKLEEFYKSIGLEPLNNSPSMLYINDILRYYDFESKSVDGMVCDTREQAEYIRKNLNEIKEFMSDIRPPEKDDLLDYEDSLQMKIEEFKTKFDSELGSIYIKKMENYLKQFDDNFCEIDQYQNNSQQSGKLSRKEAGKKRLVKLLQTRSKDTLEDILSLNIYKKEMLSRVGLNEDETEEADRFIYDCKDQFILLRVNSLAIKTDEDVEKVELLVKEYASRFNIENIDSLLGMIELRRIQEEIDLKYRTVFGIECDTRDEADIARIEFEEFIKNVRSPLPDDLLEYEKALLYYKSHIENDFKSPIKSKCINIVNAYLAVFDDNFCSMGLFKKGTRQQAADYKALKYVKTMKCNTEEGLQNAYVQLDEFLPRVGITRKQATETLKYLDKMREKINKPGLFRKILG